MSFIDPWFMSEPTAPIDVPTNGTIDNLPTTDLDQARTSMLRFLGAAPTLNGLVPASTTRGQRIHLRAVGGPLILANESASSLAANRIVTGTGANATITQGASAWLVYDVTSQRWSVSHGGGSGGGGGGTTPTGTGLRKVSGGVEAAAASLLVNADVASGAAIASSKLAPPGTDGQIIWRAGGAFAATSGITTDGTWFGFGAVPAGIGTAFRSSYAATDVLWGVKDSGGTDRELVARTAANAFRIGPSTSTALDCTMQFGNLALVGATTLSVSGAAQAFQSPGAYGLWVGSNSSWGNQHSAIYVHGSSSVALGIGSTTYLYCTGGFVETWQAVKGSTSGAVPFKWASATVAGAPTSVTATAAQYSCPHIVVTNGTAAAAFKLVLPLTTGCEWTIVNASSYTLTVGGTTGVVVSMPAGTASKVNCYDGANFIKVT